MGMFSKKYDLAEDAIKKQPPDTEKAFRLLEDAWNAGDPRAAQALGMWYLHGGKQIRQNKRRGLTLLRAAAREGAPYALFNLALCYERGFAVKANPRMAFDCYLRAAISGDNEAILEVARCYYHGIGVMQDRRTARIWQARADELGVREDNE
jgi:TPR repeat protein